MKKVICVVEDEKAINDLVAQYLKKEGYEVRSYHTVPRRPVSMSVMMMCICGFWISCWMTRAVLI